MLRSSLAPLVLLQILFLKKSLVPVLWVPLRKSLSKHTCVGFGLWLFCFLTFNSDMKRSSLGVFVCLFLFRFGTETQSPSWPPTCCLAEDDFELPILLPTAPLCSITGTHHPTWLLVLFSVEFISFSIKEQGCFFTLYDSVEWTQHHWTCCCWLLVALLLERGQPCHCHVNLSRA